MKKILILLFSIFLVFSVDAQKRYKSFAADTVQGNETVYFTYGGDDLNNWSDLSGFFFTATNTAGTVDAVYLQGSIDGTNYLNIDTLSAAADGTYFLYDHIKNISTLSATTITNTATSTIVNSVDTCGSVADTTTATSVDTTISTTTQSFVNTQQVPITLYRDYRIACDGGVGDTCVYNPVIFVAKKED